MWIIFMTDVILSLFKESQQVQSYNMIYAVLLTIALFYFVSWMSIFYCQQAVVAGMKKPNDHAEPTKVER